MRKMFHSEDHTFGAWKRLIFCKWNFLNCLFYWKKFFLLWFNFQRSWFLRAHFRTSLRTPSRNTFSELILMYCALVKILIVNRYFSKRTDKGTVLDCVNSLWLEKRTCLNHFRCLRLHFGVNSSPPEENGRHFADVMFKRIFLNENIWISKKISLKYIPYGQINNMRALVQIMAWRLPGDKPLSETMLTQFTDAYMRH